MKAVFDRQKNEMLKNQIAEAKAVIEQANQDRLDLIQSPAIGDIIEITGFVYTGKKMKVDSIGFERWSMNFVAYGVLIRKDGTPGIQVLSEVLT